MVTPAGWVRVISRSTIYYRSYTNRGPRKSACRPVRRLVVTGGRQLARLGAIGEHGPDLARAAAGRFKNKVPTVGRPTGAFGAALVARQLYNLAGSRVHDVNVVVVIGSTPTEG